jgi:hypothetical protein
MVDPTGGDDGDPGVPTMNTKKHRRQTFWKAMSEI